MKLMEIFNKAQSEKMKLSANWLTFSSFFCYHIRMNELAARDLTFTVVA